MKKRVAITQVISACLCLGMMLALSGCSTLQSKSGSGSAATPSGTSVASSSPTSTSAQTAAKENTPVYYDFGDIMVPRELSVVKKDSLVMTSGGVTSGILVLKGSVNVNSLSNFFENKMPIDGWRKMGSFRSAQSIFLFEKPTRWCVIAITDGNFSSKVEIWVAPLDRQDASGLSR